MRRETELKQLLRLRTSSCGARERHPTFSGDRYGYLQMVCLASPLGWRLQVKASHPFLQFGNGNVSTAGAGFPIHTTMMHSYHSELRSLQLGLHPGGVACCDRSVEPVSGARMPIRMHRLSILVHFGYSDHWYLTVSIPLLVVLVHFFFSFPCMLLLQGKKSFSFFRSHPSLLRYRS